MSSFEIISDYSKTSLTEIPENILEMTNLKMLFLERNFLVKLPENFFYRLPNLMWLDLRNNQLEELPKSVAHHEHLEHLLLTNNNIRKLPNELGLVSNLKALQIADNPLVYPSKIVVQEGTKSIKRFLKEQYETGCARNAEKQRETIESQEEYKRQMLEKEKVREYEEETLIRVHEKISDNASVNKSAMVSREAFQNVRKLRNIKSKESATSNRSTTRTLEYIQNKLADPNGLAPTLRVKKIDYPNKKPEEPLKIIHKISKNDSKISLKSYFNKPGVKGNLDEIPENVLKEGWLNKLRILLNDQERILQQERNLKALSSWRQKRPSTPKMFHDSENNSSRISEPPYATYPEYAKIPSRGELAAQLQAFLEESDINRRPVQTSQINLDKIINDLVEQLKEMESNPNKTNSPRSQMNYTGKQIHTLIDIHKKLLQLKYTNDYL